MIGGLGNNAATLIQGGSSMTVQGPNGNMVLDVAGNTFTDARTAGSQNGLEYAADYSADFTNRSLVDKEYVDSTANNTASNGLTKVGNDIQLGGQLSGNTTVDSNGATMTFDDTAGTGSFIVSGHIVNSITGTSALL